MSVKRRQGSGDQKDLFDQVCKRRCATAQPAKAEPDLERARRRKR
jgi:hypothetical protein